MDVATSDYRRNRTEMATNEYANSVPMDIISTSFLMSNINAIRARKKDDQSVVHLFSSLTWRYSTDDRRHDRCL